VSDHDELLARADAWTHPPSGEPLTSSVRSHAVRTGFDGALDLVAELAAALRAALATQPQSDEITWLRQTVRDLCGALDYPDTITERFVTGEAAAGSATPEEDT